MSQPAAPAQRAAPLSMTLVLAVIATRLLVWWLSGERYGYMSDELYFLDAATHPAFGYVDFPPLIAWLAFLLEWLHLDNLVALRGFSALTGIATTLAAVELCRELGGGSFARWTTALFMLLAPGFLSVQGLFTMNALDQLWWVTAFLLTARLLNRGEQGNMLWLGAVLGLGVLTKLSILALCAALPVAFLFWRRDLFQRASTWSAAVLALLVAAPFLSWQILNDYPFFDFIAAYNSNAPKAMVLQNPTLGLLLTMNPAYILVWGPGALFALLSSDRSLRVLGTAAWVCLALFVLAGVKFYFAVPVFALFAVAGALFWERRAAASRSLRAVLMIVLLSGVLVIPTAVPLLPDPLLQQLANRMRDGEKGRTLAEPADLERYFPHFAEMHGWPQLVDLVAGDWAGLSAQQRDGAVLMASHYGQSAALNRLDAEGRLPPAYGRHMTYSLWSAGLVYQRGLFVGFTAAELEPLFERVEERGRFSCSLCMSREQGLRVYYVEGPRLPAGQLHERLRRYDFF